MTIDLGRKSGGQTGPHAPVKKTLAKKAFAMTTNAVNAKNMMSDAIDRAMRATDRLVRAALGVVDLVMTVRRLRPRGQPNLLECSTAIVME